MKDEYPRLKKKYKKLPSIDWIKENFPFSPEQEMPILVQIGKAVNEKLNSVIETIESLISGGESYRSYFEARMLSREEKEKLFDVYRNLQELVWGSNKFSIERKEKEYVEWLINLKERWEKLKPLITKFCEKMETSWKEYKKETASTAYHG